MRNLVTWNNPTLWMKLQKIDEIAHEDLNLTNLMDEITKNR
jgi:hypothetical protein